MSGGGFWGKVWTGPEAVPHTHPDFFNVFYFGCQTALLLNIAPGRFLGLEARPRRWNKDYVLSVVNANAQQRDARRGKVPGQWFRGKPRLTDHSWVKMWWPHIQWRSWMQERAGPSHRAV